MRLIIMNSIFAFAFSNVCGMPSCIFPSTIVNTGNIVPVDFLNPQAKERANDLRLKPIINTRRVAPVGFTNPQILNSKQKVNEYLRNFLKQKRINREFAARNNKLGLVPPNPLDLYANTNNLPFGFFPPQGPNFFLPNVSAQMNQNSLMYNFIPQENQFSNTFVNFDNQGLRNNNIVQQATETVEKSRNGMDFACLSPIRPLDVIDEKSEERKNIIYYRKKGRKEKRLGKFIYKHEDNVMQGDSCIIRTKVEQQVYTICKTYDQTRDIDEFFCSLTNLPLLSVIRSQRWVINKILDVFESANSETHISLFLKIYPKKISPNTKIQKSSRRYYNVFGYIAKLCNYESVIRAYNLYTPIIFEQQNGTDIVSALQSDDFTGKKTKLFILNQIYKEALEYQKKGETPAKTKFVNKNNVEKRTRNHPDFSTR